MRLAYPAVLLLLLSSASQLFLAARLHLAGTGEYPSAINITPIEMVASEESVFSTIFLAVILLLMVYTLAGNYFEHKHVRPQANASSTPSTKLVWACS